MTAAFDYLIVGAGSAGCVLANRLSASGRHSVLLLEAGGSDQRFWLRTPIGYGKSFYDPAVNWMYRTEPDPGLSGRQGYWPRGKVLGGSSSINAMVFIRGLRTDFEDWGERLPAWSWEAVLPYFRKLEDSAFGPSEWRGAGGPVRVSDVSAQVHPLCERYLRAGEQAGEARVKDLNEPQPEGVGLYQITTREGRRESAATAYLHPAMQRPNLHVLTHAHATRVLFDGSRAVGVAYTRHGEQHEVRARREVLLAAGAVASPQLLLLSGVGPAEELQALGLPVQQDSPAVGRHLQDHLCIDHLYRAKVPTLNDELGPWHRKLGAGLRYLLHREGPLALSVNQGGGFVRSRPGLARPNLQLYFSPLSYLKTPPGTRALLAPDPYPGFLLSAQPCRPTSRGRLRLRSADPLAAPLIEPAGLSTEHDVQEMLEGAAYLRRLAAMPALREVIDHELVPGAAVQSPEAMLHDIRQRAGTVFHPVSTCRMGTDPRSSVLDTALRVHGVAGLRVIDASAFPCLTSGNTNAPTLMLAERGADLVLKDAPA